jgi:hypothetical protein
VVFNVTKRLPIGLIVVLTAFIIATPAFAQCVSCSPPFSPYPAQLTLGIGQSNAISVPISAASSDFLSAKYIQYNAEVKIVSTEQIPGQYDAGLSSGGGMTRMAEAVTLRVTPWAADTGEGRSITKRLNPGEAMLVHFEHHAIVIVPRVTPDEKVQITAFLASGE